MIRAADLSTEDRRLFRQEELIVEVTEVLAEALATTGMTKSELAQKLGRSKAFVTQILGGGRNLTLRTLSDVADALNRRPRLRLDPRQISGKVIKGRWKRSPQHFNLQSQYLEGGAFEPLEGVA